MKILNLYAGIGGNRKLWTDVEVTAVELNPRIAKIYQDFFPDDDVFIEDAHRYLIENFEDFDFIWSSPPCPSHSIFRKTFSCNVNTDPVYPDMKLYEEILFLKYYFKGKWCIENVMSYYQPLIIPTVLQRHYFWTNFILLPKRFPKTGIDITGGKHKTTKEHNEKLQKLLGISLDKYKGIDKRTLLRNCVLPELGLHILNESKRNIQPELFNRKEPQDAQE
jgi:DNA (cytosine-5)-methyltransferase 1